MQIEVKVGPDDYIVTLDVEMLMYDASLGRISIRDSKGCYYEVRGVNKRLWEIVETDLARNSFSESLIRNTCVRK